MAVIGLLGKGDFAHEKRGDLRSRIVEIPY